MENKELYQARHRLVVKANDLIQKSKFDLSLSQQKVVLYLISQIKPDDDDLKLYEFSIKEFCQICGITNDSGNNYAKLKEAIKEIADKSIWVTLDNGKQTLLRWIEKPYINENSGTIQIKLDKDMKPYLLHLQNNFTCYELFWTLQFKRKYSMRLYELIKSIHFNEAFTFEKIYELEDFRRLMGAENYVDWASFRKRALEPAIDEINGYSDKLISYEPITYGKTVGKIKLILKTKQFMEKYTLAVANDTKLGGYTIIGEE